MVCVSALGRCGVINPDEFLTDVKVKYLGWLLNDTEWQVLLAQMQTHFLIW